MDKNAMTNWSISSELVLKEAKKMGLKVEVISENNNLFSVSNQEKKIYFKSNDCGINSLYGYKLTEDKELTYLMCEKNNIKVPKGICLNLKDYEEFDFKNINLNFPLVTKPFDGAHGDGVKINIQNIEELKKAIKYSSLEGSSQKIIIQEQISGDDHRILVIGDEVVACTKRIPPYIIGNGKNTIKELIDFENKNPLRGEGNHTSPMSQIKIDEELENTIKSYGYNFDTILKKDEKINVRKNANLSSGGLAIDCTDVMSESVKSICLSASKLFSLNLAGVDIMTTDISKPLDETSGSLIEINTTPGLRMHHFPFEGKPRNVAKKLLDYLF